ncbi:MAG: LLM class flavin-dependent oxidoreductase [Dehalococcoidia bacterium]|nr:LLM class flavin-dependent oxidoreductase [Dehalococcoidia bacterium]
MKIGLALPIYARWFQGDPALQVLNKAKALGVESLWLVDHIILTPTQAIGYGNSTPDIWTASAYFAGACNALDYHPYFGQAVAVIPWRPPIQQAQVLATIDHLSGGKLIIGAGSGHIPEAFEALDIPFEERTARTDEYLKCMMTLWKHPTASFHGKYANFDNMTIMVRPQQRPYPPILYGGRGPRPFRRIGEYCQGYLPAGVVSVSERRSRRHGKIGEPSIFEGKPVFPWDEEELTGPERFQRDMAELMKYWKRYGRTGRPYVATTTQVQLTDDRRESDAGTVTRGVIKPGEDSFQSTYQSAHVDDLVAALRAMSDLGVDHIAIRPGAYRYKERNQLENLMHQLDLLGEHVLPKIPKDTAPIGPFSYAESIEGMGTG